jgi:uncharacterized membrane protein YdjX (TVP38/TMEM64 family)
VLLSFTLVWRYTPLAAWYTVENITAWVDRFAENWWAPVLIVLAYTPASIVMFPAAAHHACGGACVRGGARFRLRASGHPACGFPRIRSRAALDRTTVRRIVGERLNRIADAVRRGGLPAMTAIRLVPVAPFIVVNIAAGAIRIRYWHFAAATALGMVPGALVATLLGDQLKNALHPTGGLNYWLIGGWSRS